jgi:hypothetical protein
MNIKDRNTDQYTERTYTYNRRYILQDGTIKNCDVTLTRKFKPNAKIINKINFTDAQKSIVKEIYNSNKNFSQTTNIINNDHFPITYHYVKKIVNWNL